MLAAVLSAVGTTPRYQRFPEPEAGDGETVVRVTAAALKPFDRWWAAGRHPAGPGAFPQVVGADGVGELPDGRRVAFLTPRPPHGGMAERTLVRDGLWFPVPDDVDDLTAAAVLNPGLAAWKALVWEGGLTAGESVLVLGATGASGRIAAHLALRAGARVVVAGRNPRVLDALLARGARAAVGVDRSPAELTAALVAAGPFDVVVDYLWGAPAEAAFGALRRPGGERIRYLQVGMSAGETAAVPAMALRAAPVQLTGSGVGGRAGLAEAGSAYADLLGLVAAGEVVVDVDAVPLSAVESAWTAADAGRRVVFVP